MAIRSLRSEISSKLTTLALQVLQSHGQMDNGIHYLVPIPAFLHYAFDASVDGQEMLYLPDILGFLDHVVVLHGKL